MPLVVPQVSDDDKAAWVDRLLGKRITDDTSDHMVRTLPPYSTASAQYSTVMKGISC